MKRSVVGLWFGMELVTGGLLGVPEARITFQVKDDFGHAVSNAPVWASTFWRWVPGPGFGRDISKKIHGVTDSQGKVTLSVPCKTGTIDYGVHTADEKQWDALIFNGTRYHFDSGGAICFRTNSNHRWLPWNPQVEMTVKPILKPTPLYARRFGYDGEASREWQKVPEFNKAIGLDLMAGDWVAPYGKGRQADIIFRLDCKLGGTTSGRDRIYDAKMTLSFANDGDGIQVVMADPNRGCYLSLPRYAPEDGYQASWSKEAFQHEGEFLWELREDRNFFFRVRTRKDASGKIVSALYGKIYGDVDLSGCWKRVFRFIYYLNPTPNDRNLECDLKRSMFTNLTTFEKVSRP